MALYIPHSIFHLALLLYVRPQTFGPYYVACVSSHPYKQCMIRHYHGYKLIGYVAGPFSIRCFVRQGCRMSMLLFALIMNPLLYLLQWNLKSIRTGHRTRKTAVVTHANCVMISVRTPEDIQQIGDFLRTYERATVACLNIRKSKGMAADSRDTSINRIDIPYYPEITTLGFRFTSTSNRHLVEGDRKGQSPGEWRTR